MPAPGFKEKSFTPMDLQAPAKTYIDTETLKAERIARACSLNAAAVTMESCARVFVANQTCKDYDLLKLAGLMRGIKTAEYHHNLSLLGVPLKAEDKLDF